MFHFGGLTGGHLLIHVFWQMVVFITSLRGNASPPSAAVGSLTLPTYVLLRQRPHPER